jgi:hypothetical protein
LSISETKKWFSRVKKGFRAFLKLSEGFPNRGAPAPAQSAALLSERAARKALVHEQELFDQLFRSEELNVLNLKVSSEGSKSSIQELELSCSNSSLKELNFSNSSSVQS